MKRSPVNIRGEPSAGSDDTVGAVFTDIPDNATSDRGKVHPGNSDVAMFYGDVEITETK